MGPRGVQQPEDPARVTILHFMESSCTCREKRTGLTNKRANAAGILWCSGFTDAGDLDEGGSSGCDEE